MIGRTLTLDKAAALLDRLSVMASLRFFTAAGAVCVNAARSDRERTAHSRCVADNGYAIDLSAVDCRVLGGIVDCQRCSSLPLGFVDCLAPVFTTGGDVGLRR